jgi:hypothetical protein
VSTNSSRDRGIFRSTWSASCETSVVGSRGSAFNGFDHGLASVTGARAFLDSEERVKGSGRLGCFGFFSAFCSVLGTLWMNLLLWPVLEPRLRSLNGESATSSPFRGLVGDRHLIIHYSRENCVKSLMRLLHLEVAEDQN